MWLACVAFPGAYACVLTSLSGCVDLFHSTDFGGPGCSSEAGAAGCRDGSAMDATKPRDAGKDVGDAHAHADATSTRPKDATVDHHAPVSDGGSDATDGSVAVEGGSDGATEATTVVEAGSPDVVTTHPLDAGTDFCTKYNSTTAAAAAAHACFWLTGCGGSVDLNEFGTCYPNALRAYDCALNPNQKVRGALHAYWDVLATATSCEQVYAAVFGQTPPACTNASAVCGSDLVDGGMAFGNVLVQCMSNTLISAVNCSMAGYVCSESAGACAVPKSNSGPCQDAGVPASVCQGGVFHSCQTVENNPGVEPPTVVVDVGRDCTNFGAGVCSVAGGGAGCVPNDAGATCTPSTQAACGDGGVVTGCATGHLEVLNCPLFGGGSACAIGPEGWYASSSDLTRGCYNPSQNGFTGAFDDCVGENSFSDYAGPCGSVDVTCPMDAGFDDCVLGHEHPYCPHPN